MYIRASQSPVSRGDRGRLTSADMRAHLPLCVHTHKRLTASPGIGRQPGSLGLAFTEIIVSYFEKHPLPLLDALSNRTEAQWTFEMTQFIIPFLSTGPSHPRR